MTVNKFKITRDNISKKLTIPLEVKFDPYGRQQMLDKYTDEIIQEIINPPKDYEIARFSHEQYGLSLTSTNYQFYFFDNAVPIQNVGSNATYWKNTYTTDFTNDELYYYANSFTNSFFKLDLYDSKNKETQKVYLTIILPVQQGKFEPVTLQNGDEVEVRKPNYQLDFIGDKEGYFIYWLKDVEVLGLTEFYMSAKFFNGKTGEFVRFLNKSQSSISGNNSNFNPEDNFYYKVNLNYDKYTYTLSSFNNDFRAGTTMSPIKFYEYVNS